MGGGTEASSPSATAMGVSTTASGDNATAMNHYTTASGNHATAMGNQTTASGRAATAVGNQTTASGGQATAMGYSTTAATANSLTIGEYNSANQTADGTLFVVGNGSGSNSRSDALVLDNSGNLKIAGTLNDNSTSSDRRLKEEVEPVGEGTLERLLRLRPVRFQFKDQASHQSGPQLGLIAQDVRKEFPALVSTRSDGYLSLAYPKLTSVLLKGLQEQQDQIESQRSQIDRQQATIDSLKEHARRIEEVEKRLTALEAGDSPVAAGWFGGAPRPALGLLLLGGLLGAGLVAVRS